LIPYFKQETEKKSRRIIGQKTA